MTNGTIVYYCGIAIVALSLILGVLALIVGRRRAKRLRETLDKEYGPEKKKGGKA